MEIIYRIQTNQAEKAAELLKTSYPDKIKALSKDSFDIEINKDTVPAVIYILAANSIEVFGVARIETSLEDGFLQITGGGLTIE